MDRPGLSPAQLQEVFGGALLVAVDSSPPSASALRFAAQLAHRTGTPLRVLMVWNVLIGPAPDAPLSRPATEEQRQDEAERVLAAFVEQALHDTDRPELHLHAVHGNVDPLLEEVSALAEHVVVGSRGRGGVADLVLGSTSGRLVNVARCPVTVVPTPRS